MPDLCRQAQVGPSDGGAQWDWASAASIIAHSDDAIIAKTLDGTVLSWNAAAEKIFGYTAEEMIGQPITRLFPEDRLHEEADLIAQVQAGGEIAHFETRRVRKDGALIDVSVSLSALRDRDGHIAAVSKIARDITDQKRLQSQVQQLTADLQQVLEDSPLMVGLWGADQTNRYSNALYAASMGLTPERLFGLHVAEALGPALYELAKPRIEAALAGEPQSFEHRVALAGGGVRHDLVNYIPGKRVGEHRGFFVFSRDITRRVEAELAAAEAARRFQHLYEDTPVMLHATDPNGRLLSVSNAWLKNLGYARDDVLGTDVADYLTPHSRIVRQNARQAIDSTGRFENVSVQMVCKTGRVMDVLVSAIIERDKDEQPSGTLAVLQDVTDRLRAERALAQSEGLLNRTGALAGVGGWELDLKSGELSWSEQTRRIHGVGPAYRPSLETAINFYAPEGQPLISAAVASAIASGTDWDLELPFIPAGGGQIWVRATGHAESERGQVVRLVGAFQDVTEQVVQRRALEAARERMVLATDSGGIGIWDYDPVSGEVTTDDWMDRLFKVQGRSGPRAFAEWLAQVHEDDRDSVINAIADSVASGRPLDIEFRVRWPDASVRRLKATAQVHHGLQGSTRMVGVCRDVTELHELGAELARQHELMRVTLASIGDAVLTTDALGRVTWLNPTAERMTGWCSGEAKGRPSRQVLHLVHESTREPAASPIEACLRNQDLAGLAHHTVLISRNGVEYGIEDSASPIRSADSTILGTVLVFHDVTEQRRISGEMTYRATHDALTGLVNRAEFESRLKRVLEVAHHRHGQNVLFYIDLDQFKLVNDACGHSVGDQLLQQISKLLSEIVRSRDTLARLGGDEFAVILEHCEVDQAQRVAQAICDRMDDFRFIHDDRRFRVGASIGMVPLDERWASAAAVMQAADAACYAAKEAGRNRVHVWFDTDATLRTRHGQTQWATRLEHALDEEAFVLHLQRIIPLEGANQGLHAEVLLRMRDADGSLIPPGVFLPAAERFHLATRIDRWVIHNVVRQLTRLPSLAAIDLITVNVSGQSVGDRSFHRAAVEELRAAGPEVCGRLCIEITETAAITNMSEAALFIEQLRDLGVRTALDDFGAGASSFGYLKTLKINILKIDGQFIRDILDDPLDDAAVRCFVDVARVLGVECVAEFVDRPDVLSRIRELGVNYAQGFLLHKPEDMAAVLETCQV